MSNVLDNLIVELIETHEPPPPGSIPPAPEQDQAADAIEQDTRNTPPQPEATSPSQSSQTAQTAQIAAIAPVAPIARPNGIHGDPDGTKELIKLLQEQVEDLKSDRDRWREQAENAQYLLARGVEMAESPQKRTWWKWWSR